MNIYLWELIKEYIDEKVSYELNSRSTDEEGYRETDYEGRKKVEKLEKRIELYVRGE